MLISTCEVAAVFKSVACMLNFWRVRKLCRLQRSHPMAAQEVSHHVTLRRVVMSCFKIVINLSQYILILCTHGCIGGHVVAICSSSNTSLQSTMPFLFSIWFTQP